MDEWIAMKPKGLILMTNPLSSHYCQEQVRVFDLSSDIIVHLQEGLHMLMVPRQYIPLDFFLSATSRLLFVVLSEISQHLLKNCHGFGIFSPSINTAYFFML